MATQSEKGKFMKAVTVLCDTREQKNEHVISKLDEYGVAHECVKLDAGDYSFSIAGRDFSRSCVIERKASVDELYTNIMEGGGTRKGERIEKELQAARMNGTQMVLLLENCAGWDNLKAYVLPDWKMKMSDKRVVADIGRFVYPRLKSWQPSNRYNLRVEFAADSAETASKMLEEFYYWYHNYKELIAARR